MISVEHLTKYYGNTPAITDVSFTVEAGEIFGFLGPNGAGKTTTIRLLLNLLYPNSGIIRIFNSSLREHTYQIRKRCGYLPGDFSVYENLTGEEFLKFFARLRRSHYPQQKNLIELLSVGNEIHRKIKHLSQGTRQKLGIIQAFAHLPELVILDEPTSGLDPLVKESFYQFLLEYQGQGNSIFLSSHNLPEVEKICHRVAIIRHGVLVALEETAALKKKRYRKMFIELEQPMDLPEIDGAQLLQREGTHYTFLLTGEVIKVIRSLSPFPVKDLILPEPDLEEAFMYYYQDKQND